MNIIPVIDLMHGSVVHAKLGQRQNYQPIHSLLCDSSEATAVVNSFLELYPFTRLYIADLDAITGQGHHQDTIAKIQALHPGLEIWLDAGIRNASSLASWSSFNITHIIGSENIVSPADLIEISQMLHGHFVLSLDFKQTEFLGHPALLTQTELWPEKLVVMTLNRVGSHSGLDTDRLKAIINLANGREVYAAGGVRNNDDIQILQDLELAGVLVASALHNKKLNPNTI